MSSDYIDCSSCLGCKECAVYDRACCRCGDRWTDARPIVLIGLDIVCFDCWNEGE